MKKRLYYSRQNRRYIVHVDMDAFFASIEQRDNHAYRSKPVIVGADPKGGKGRGVVSTCSYEARAFGIHSAMPISAAYNRCPHGVFVPPDMGKYETVSAHIFRILYSFTPDIEAVGIDEAFLDITGSFHLFGTPLETCLLIKSKVRQETSLTASIGLAPTKMAAKIASDIKKPDGMVEVTEEKLLDFLWPLHVRRLWGVGKKCEEMLAGMGIRTLKELAGTDVTHLEKVLGANGRHLWLLANGIDESRVETEIDSKSVSNEITFEHDTADDEKIRSSLVALCEKVSGRLRRDKWKCRTVILKIRLEGFHTYTRSVTLPESTNFTDSLYKAAKDLYNNFSAEGRKVRLIGVRAANLIPTDYRDSLFPERDEARRKAIDTSVDNIRGRFGDGAIYRAASRGE